MGSLAEFPLHYRAFLRAYPWRRIDPVPWSPLRRPLAESRIGVVTTAGLVAPGDNPFDPTVLGGDYTFRILRGDMRLPLLVETHRSKLWDHSGFARDPNVVLPLDRLREMVAAGRLGTLNGRHLSFMGSLTAPGRLIARSAPEAAELFVADQVDVALLVPV